ncbi:MAG: hypothetical protein ABWZ26_07500, partial [Candidatus Nanopelagicales bacterium]
GARLAQLAVLLRDDYGHVGGGGGGEPLGVLGGLARPGRRRSDRVGRCGEVGEQHPAIFAPGTDSR